MKALAEFRKSQLEIQRTLFKLEKDVKSLTETTKTTAQSFDLKLDKVKHLGAVVDTLIEEKEKKIRAVLYKVSEVKDELVAHHLDFEQKQADLTHKHENKLRIFNQGLKTMEKGYQES